jgi:hypothetical protein
MKCFPYLERSSLKRGYRRKVNHKFYAYCTFSIRLRVFEIFVIKHRWGELSRILTPCELLMCYVLEGSNLHCLACYVGWSWVACLACAVICPSLWIGEFSPSWMAGCMSTAISCPSVWNGLLCIYISMRVQVFDLLLRPSWLGCCKVYNVELPVVYVRTDRKSKRNSR